MMRIQHLLLAMLLLFVIPVSAYQQGRLAFTLDSWTVSEQRMDVQSFVKDKMYLEVRVSEGGLVDPVDIAKELEGKVTSSRLMGQVNETVVSAQGNLYIFTTLPYGKETYVVTFLGKDKDLSKAQSELDALYKSFTFSAEPNFVQASWEKSWQEPQRPSLLRRLDIPWGWILLLLVIGGIAGLIIRRFLRKKK